MRERESMCEWVCNKCEEDTDVTISANVIQKIADWSS